MTNYSTGVFIGRFQPVHFAHLYVIESALTQCERLVIIVGSANRAVTVKNPFTANERIKLLQENLAAINPDYLDRIAFEPIEDTMYDEKIWLERVTAAVNRHSQDKSIAVIGHDKDSTTYYLDKFPEWHRIELANHRQLNATKMRQLWFAAISAQDIAGISGLPKPTIDYLQADFDSERYRRLKLEYAFIQSYKNIWAGVPYPVILQTTDSLVICADHILLIQRGRPPGQGLWALPGGFLEYEEWVENGILRELREETDIAMDDAQLQQHLKTIRTFDHPERSQLGRVITTVGHFELPGKLPAVSGSDDATLARWIPLAELDQYREHLHDDHYYIIQSCLFWHEQRAVESR